MIVEEQVKEKLKEVLVPGAMRNLNMLNLIREIAVSDGSIKVILASAGINTMVPNWIEIKVKELLQMLPDVREVRIEFTEARHAELNAITHTFAVMSGKGGVGKSLVTGLAAIALKRRGYEVGILDADITGPSIPRIFGITERPAGNENGILPVLSRSGIAVMSINLLLPSEDEAVIWRGPLKSNKAIWRRGTLGQT